MTDIALQQIGTLVAVLIAITIPAGLIGYTFLMLRPKPEAGIVTGAAPKA